MMDGCILFVKTYVGIL